MIKLEVRGQVYKIDLVSNWVRKKYSEMVEVSGEIQVLTSTIGDIVSRLKKIENAQELPELQKEAEHAKQEIQEKTKEIAEIRDEIIREILESNGHDYVRDWWEKKTSPEDINDFIITCLNKDYEPGKDSSVKKK
jgi:predicted transcriptional regulator